MVADVTYVASNGTAVYPYSSWATAATNIQDAVDAAPPGGTVRVAGGTYDSGWRVYRGATNRVVVDKPLSLIAEAAERYETMIEGEGNDGTGAVRCVYLASGSRMEGFTLASGATYSNAVTSWLVTDGAGALCESGAVLTNCWITSNRSAKSGGGVMGGELWSCEISGNRAMLHGGGARASKAYGTEFFGNYAHDGGGLAEGAAYNSVFLTNSAGSGGGGAYQSSAESCSFAYNYAAGYGGGAYNGTLAQCYFTNNSAQMGGGSAGCSADRCRYFNNRAFRGDFMYVSARGGAVSGGTNRNCLMVGNVAETYGGGANNASLYNCTVTATRPLKAMVEAEYMTG